MKARTLLPIFGLVLSVGPLSAQSDPISGKWGRDGATFMDLKLDDAGAVTGQVMSGRPDNMAAIKSGSFNRQTGALQLEGESKNPDSGALMPFSIQGNLLGDSLKVNATFGSYQGSLAFVRISASQALPAMNEELGKGFAAVHEAVAKSADMVPAGKYTYRPVATVRTFGELVGHIADSYTYYCARAAGRNVQWSDAIEKGTTDKTTVTRKLSESVAVCTAAYENTGSHFGGLVNNIAHTNLHYGNIITYLRMMGLVPPSS